MKGSFAPSPFDYKECSRPSTTAKGGAIGHLGQPVSDHTLRCAALHIRPLSSAQGPCFRCAARRTSLSPSCECARQRRRKERLGTKAANESMKGNKGGRS